MKYLIVTILFFIAGCSTSGVDKDLLDTTNKQLADKTVFIQTLTRHARSLSAQGVISIEQAQKAHDSLQDVLDDLKSVQRAMRFSGDPLQAKGTLEKADATVNFVLQLLGES